MATSSGLRGDAARLKAILSILRQRGATRGLTPEKLRLVLEDLGPTFMKIGQLLSLRSDMIPREYCQELAKLRTEAAPMPLTEVRAAVENELGAPLTELFSTFDEAPLGSASIAAGTPAPRSKAGKRGRKSTAARHLRNHGTGYRPLAARGGPAQAGGGHGRNHRFFPGAGRALGGFTAGDGFFAGSRQRGRILPAQRGRGLCFLPEDLPRVHHAACADDGIHRRIFADDLEALDRAGYDRRKSPPSWRTTTSSRSWTTVFFMPTRTRAICASAAGRSSGSTWA